MSVLPCLRQLLPSLRKNLGWSLRCASRTRRRSGGHSATALARPRRNQTPLVDIRILLQLFHFSTLPAVVFAEEVARVACSISHIATLAGADQPVPATPWTACRVCASGGSRLLSIMTSKRSGKLTQRNKSNTEGMARSLQCTQNLCLCLSLCQTNLHMTVAVEAPPIRKMHARLCQPQRMLSSGTLRGPGSQRPQVCVCLCGQQYSLQLGSPSTNCTRAALPIRRRCHQVAQQLGSFTAQSSTSLKDQRSHGRAISLRFLRFSQLLLPPWFRRTFVVTFCVRASHADVYPELLQDARAPGDHV